MVYHWRHCCEEAGERSVWNGETAPLKACDDAEVISLFFREGRANYRAMMDRAPSQRSGTLEASEMRRASGPQRSAAGDAEPISLRERVLNLPPIQKVPLRLKKRHKGTLVAAEGLLAVARAI